jgi:hypothetical protein
LSISGIVTAAATTDLIPSEEELRPRIDPETGIDLSLIEENLRLTPWERMLANDDAVNFGNMLREAVARANAAP